MVCRLVHSSASGVGNHRDRNLFARATRVGVLEQPHGPCRRWIVAFDRPKVVYHPAGKILGVGVGVDWIVASVDKQLSPWFGPHPFGDAVL